MAATSKRSYVYVGLAGETAPGRVIKSGLYRMSDDDGEWKLVTRGLPEAPAIRSIAVHPLKPEVVYAGTQSGPYRSTDNGDHWEKVNVPDHGKPVWSLMFHPRDPNVVFAGYEDCEIYRSDNCGETWKQLPVSVRFPEVAVGPGSNPAKRLLTLAGLGNGHGPLPIRIEGQDSHLVEGIEQFHGRERRNFGYFHLGRALIEALRWLRATNTTAHTIGTIDDHDQT